MQREREQKAELAVTARDEADTVRVAAAVAHASIAGDVLALAGDLGSGKTAFARGFIRALAAPDEEVPSPTFTLVQTFAAARAVADTLVLRDYHVDNLMLLGGRAGVAACGLLDFQDAVTGPASYDLVSLLEDARRDVPADLASRMIARYLDAFPALDRDAFRASYAVMGAQRSAKVVGIFTRLDRRDGKPVYLEHIPRVWRWLEGDLRHPALAGLRAWFDRELPVGTRVTPETTGGDRR